MSTFNINHIRWNQIGRTIGFPTINSTCFINETPTIDPGLYASTLIITWNNNIQCISSISIRGNQYMIETHIINTNPDTLNNIRYGKNYKLNLHEKLRSYKRYKNIDEVKTQIPIDVELGEVFFKNRKLCSECYYSCEQDDGYSNYTVEDTETMCLIECNPMFPFYSGKHNLISDVDEFAKQCHMYKKGDGWHYDIDNEEERMDEDLRQQTIIIAKRLKKYQKILKS